MTEQQISYVDGFSAQDYYEGIGALRGSNGRGNMFSLLVRDSLIYRSPLTLLFRGLLGNFNSTTGGGWMVGADSNPDVPPPGAMIYMGRWRGGGSVAPLNLGGESVASAIDRAVLMMFCYGAENDAAAADNNWSGWWVNGQLQGQIPFGPSPGSDYIAAAADQPFRVGDVDDVQAGPWTGAGMGGFSFRDGLPDEGSGDNFPAIDEIARAQWNTVVETGDLADDDDLGEVFSARRGAANAPATWTGSKGTTLNRVGNPTGSSFRDRFYASTGGT